MSAPGTAPTVPEVYTGGRHVGEKGSGTVAVVGILVVALLLAVFVLTLGAIHTQVVRVRAVADLAALAGAEASAVARWVDAGTLPCERVAAVVAANGMQVSSCSVAQADTRVVVGDTVVLLGLPLPVEARARAGPAGG